MGLVNWTNVTTPADMLAIPNTNTGGSFWATILWLVVIVLFISMLSFGFEVALMTACVIGVLGGLLLVYAGLVSWSVVLMFLGILLFVIIYVMWSNKNR
jgi:hypothetical protein